jgi:hypothetical protein
MLQGANFGEAPNEGMFLGIPYAAAPTGVGAGSLRSRSRNGRACEKQMLVALPATVYDKSMAGYWE